MPDAADMINLSFLTESEQELILEVLRRDAELRLAEEQRVRKLKAELLDIRRKGAKRGNGSELKKSTGDWFYDQRVNRFSSSPGHNIVRASLKARPSSKRETVGELLLQSSETKPSQPNPVPRPRMKNMAANREAMTESKDEVETRESEESEQPQQKQQRSDSECAERASLSSVKTRTGSSQGSPGPPSKEMTTGQSSPAPSNLSSPSFPVKAEDVIIHSSCSDAETSPGERPPSQGGSSSPGSLTQEVDRLFKKSIRLAPKSPGFVSEQDLREDVADGPGASMGDRSKSVPGLNTQDEEEDEDEDIDSLVSIHRNTMASGTSSLRGSKSTLGSVMSIYSEAGDYDSVEVRGYIVFSLSYDESVQALNVLIKECSSLAYGDTAHKRSNPYVKCYLLPDKSRQSKKKTSVKRNTINPTYNETLKYSIGHAQLLSRTLAISVWHQGRLSRNAFLGEVEVPLDCWDLSSAHEENVSLKGKASAPMPPSAFAQYKGELVIALKYVSASTSPASKIKGKKTKDEGGQLHVLIKEAKNLTAMKTGGTSDSFVKGYLLPATAKSTKKKTPVAKKTLNPQYNHTFVYRELSVEQLGGMCLELTVWDWEAMGSNDFLGGLRLSTGKGTVKVGKEAVEMDSVGEEVNLWEKMMQYPDSWAEGALTLRSSMGKAK